MAGLISGKPQLNRRINASLVLGLILGEGPVSRADLVKRTGIRATSISAIVEHLIERGLVLETSLGKSTGGRQPMLLEINPSGLHAAGVEVGEDRLNGVIVDLSGRVIAARREDLADTRVDTVVSGLPRLLDGLCGEAQLARGALAGLGVAVPGIVSRESGSVVLSRPLGWSGVMLRDLLKESCGLDVLVLNNATAGALAESFGGRGGRTRSLLYLLVYLRQVRQQAMTSLGCGIILDGRAYLGEGHMAGELRVDIEHPLAAAARQAGPAPAAFDDLVRRSRERPDEFAPVWESFAGALGQVISHGVDFLNPGRVVVGTDTAELETLIGARLRETVRSRTVTGLVAELDRGGGARELPIGFSVLATDTLARGAIVPHLQALSLIPLLHDSVLA
jgi:predicted NBD/HSP70 family sugar kinase